MFLIAALIIAAIADDDDMDTEELLDILTSVS